MQSYYGRLGWVENRRHVTAMTDARNGKQAELQCHVASHFLDSGSFTLKTAARKYAAERKCPERDFYDVKDHWDYVDAYAAFVKEHKVAIDLYANVDVIGDAELTWRNQRYLEKKHGLDPVPVVHYGTDLSWLTHYMKRGRHEVIALGGLVGASYGDARTWLDQAFTLACPPPGRLPTVKLHGFGVTSHRMMTRYPWWSVDSASWTKTGAYGGVIVPHRRQGRWDMTEQPYTLWFTEETPSAGDKGKHFDNVSPAERKIVRAWLDEINVPLGEDNPDGTPKVLGVRNHHSERKIANLKYYERFRLSLPEWPCPFKPPVKRRGIMG